MFSGHNCARVQGYTNGISGHGSWEGRGNVIRTRLIEDTRPRKDREHRSHPDNPHPQEPYKDKSRCRCPAIDVEIPRISSRLSAVNMQIPIRSRQTNGQLDNRTIVTFHCSAQAWAGLLPWPFPRVAGPQRLSLDPHPSLFRSTRAMALPK